jgi:hypothetical protein
MRESCKKSFSIDCVLHKKYPLPCLEEDVPFYKPKKISGTKAGQKIYSKGGVMKK